MDTGLKFLSANPVTKAVTTLLLLSILAGIAGTVLPALNYMPTLGFDRFSLAPWQTLWGTPKLGNMVLLSVFSGVLATLFSLFLALGIVSTAWNRPLWQKTQRWLSPMMAAPHVALAFGLSFVLMPSGLVARFLAVPLGWSSPPGWHSIQDPYGLGLILLLVLKETPFLIFMLMAAVSQLPVRDTLRVGQSLGYQRWLIWMKLLWPRLYSMVRLPVYTLLAFSLSVVDIPLILGPTNPPLFSVQVFQWLQDADLTLRTQAAAGSLLLLGLVIAIISLFIIAEWALKKAARHWLTNGYRGQFGTLAETLSLYIWRSLLALFCTSTLVLLVWSFAWRWRFPSLWPSWSLRSWEKVGPYLTEPLYNSFIIGVLSSFAAVCLAIILLEYEKTQRGKRLSKRIRLIMYLPLLLPQMTFVFGIQVLLLWTNIEGHWMAVVTVHLIFVLPYCYLSLVSIWQHYDERQSLQAQILSGSRFKAWYKVKLKILWRPVCSALALGFAVSIAQYLPTLFAGAGRISTITTEAVSLASGGNRRLMGVYGLLQMLLPLLGYALAIAWSGWAFRQFRLVRRLNQ